MRKTRLLTDPREVAASDEFKRLLAECGKSQDQVAAEIGDGVSQGTIWQWANRRLAIPAIRAEDAARAVGGQAADISVGYLDAFGLSRIAEQRKPYSVSHRVGIPLSTIADAMLVVKAYVEDRGLPPSTAMDPVLIKVALDLVIESAEPLTLTNVIAFKKRFTERLSEDGYGDASEQVAGTG